MAAPVKPGDGLVFDGDDKPAGPSKEAESTRSSVSDRFETHRSHDPDTSTPVRMELRFGREAIDLRGLEVGQRVWKTDDPELTRRLRRTFEGPPRKLELDLRAEAIAGEPLRLAGMAATGIRATVQSSEPLAKADTQTADKALFTPSLVAWAGRSTSSEAWRRPSKAARWCR